MTLSYKNMALSQLYLKKIETWLEKLDSEKFDI